MIDPPIPDYNRRNLIIQPQVSRVRAPFRGVLDSEEWNLEAEQIRYDLSKLRTKVDALKSELIEQLSFIDKALSIRTNIGGYVEFFGTDNNYLSTTDAPALRPSGDMTYVLKLAANNWNSTALQTVVSKWSPGFLVYLNGNATQTFFYAYVYDSASVQHTVYTTLLTTASAGLVNGRFTYFALAFDMDDGAGNKAIRLSTSLDGVTWTDWGVSTYAGVVTTPQSHIAAPVLIGTVTGANPFNGKIGYVSIRNGISGTATPGGTEFYRLAENDIPADTANSFIASSGQVMTVTRAAAEPNTLLIPNTHLVGVLNNLLAKITQYDERIRRLEIQKGLKL